jgi:hypothetical protein
MRSNNFNINANSFHLQICVGDLGRYIIELLIEFGSVFPGRPMSVIT